MRRRVRLTESQLRGVVEEASRRVIQEMIDEGIWTDLGNALKTGWNSFAGSKTGQNIKNNVNTAKQTATQAAGAIGNAATNAWNGLTNIGQQAAGAIGNAAGNVAKAGANVAKAGANAAGTLVGSGVQGAKYLGNMVNNAGNMVNNGINSIGNWLSNTGLANSFRQGYNNSQRINQMRNQSNQVRR